MKIAFVSCIDARVERLQPVFTEIKKKNPDVLLLLGDTVYMDYGVGDNHIGVSKEWPPQKFCDKLYQKYSQQAEVESFKDLVSSVNRVLTCWDDHDFAWNGAYGASGGNKGENEDDNLTRATRSNYVPRQKRLISRALHLQFRDWLNGKPLSNYPAQRTLQDILKNESDAGIQDFDNRDGVQIIMTDGRYYRQKKQRRSASQLLGADQRQWLKNRLASTDTINILCSGTTLLKGSECWEEYSDLKWLDQVDLSRTIILSGDIHKNKLKQHADIQGVLEVTSSGAARPDVFGGGKLGGDEGNFGFLTVDGNKITAEIFDEDGIEDSKTIQLA